MKLELQGRGMVLLMYKLNSYDSVDELKEIDDYEVREYLEEHGVEVDGVMSARMGASGLYLNDELKVEFTDDFSTEHEKQVVEFDKDATYVVYVQEERGVYGTIEIDDDEADKLEIILDYAPYMDQELISGFKVDDKEIEIDMENADVNTKAEYFYIINVHYDGEINELIYSSM